MSVRSIKQSKLPFGIYAELGDHWRVAGIPSIVSERYMIHYQKITIGYAFAYAAWIRVSGKEAIRGVTWFYAFADKQWLLRERLMQLAKTPSRLAECEQALRWLAPHHAYFSKYREKAV